ncbi:hypothetical protein BGP78_10930 [Pseudoalteromonas sp. MSK9-3]|uniref:PulJ/GspJ family protein n=1 Tax=Pseudoalteromonas sp. MSK9-3 TaxID=1897633 RepID=UPI000E6C0870|nr:type II secretion system protein [Pseudoalteromonas sp. MSK9-3]RJE76909.1 hypothetical protein BGP78_10930 [Pseudoalteromonas sp. MSK9-3]
MNRLLGFTLIEMLITISLLSLVLATGSFTYLQLTNRWDRQIDNFELEAANARLIFQVDSLIDGVIPYIVRDEELKPSMFFVGGKYNLLAVSTNGLATGHTEVFRLTVSKLDNGSFELIYQSIPLKEITLSRIDQEIDFTNKLILAKGYEGINFLYFGWDKVSHKVARSNSFQPNWHEQYFGSNSDMIPLKITTLFNRHKSLGEYQITSVLDKHSNEWFRYYIQSEI